VAQLEAAQAAAQELAALCGLDVRHFRLPGRRPDPGYGSQALTTACEVVDVFGPAGPGEGPRAQDSALLARAREGYRKPWAGHYRALNRAFLAHEDGRRIVSPLTGGEATILGSLSIQAYEVTACLEGERLILLVGIGSMAVGILYPAESLFIVLTSYRLNFQSVLRAVLDQLTSRPVAWAGWLTRARAGELRRTFLIGDNRPSHFMRQSLAYLDVEEAAIRDFAAKGGLLLTVPDWCAMDPVAVFPSLAALERISVTSEGLTETILLSGLDAHRVYRMNIHPDAGWLRRRLALVIDSATAMGEGGRRFRVMISLDAERERVVNAVEIFRFTLRRLAEACATDGSVLDVVWDGWTVPGPPSARDLEVMGRIEAMIAAITEGPALPLGGQRRIFDRSSLDKVPYLAGCDLAITTQGTGAMIASWLLRRPTIVYHVPGAASNRDYLDDATAIDMDGRAIGAPPPDDPAIGIHQRFTLAPWGMEDALRRALAGRLVIPQECPPPAFPPPGAPV
jgi:hypothetical protein